MLGAVDAPARSGRLIATCIHACENARDPESSVRKTKLFRDASQGIACLVYLAWVRRSYYVVRLKIEARLGLLMVAHLERAQLALAGVCRVDVMGVGQRGSRCIIREKTALTSRSVNLHRSSALCLECARLGSLLPFLPKLSRPLRAG